MGKRSELRRKQRNSNNQQMQKNRTNLNPVNVLYGSPEQVQKDFGMSIQELKAYLERMEKKMKHDFQIEYQEKLLKAEDYITVGYLCVAMFALEKSRKKREHTKDLIQRMLDNLNEAQDYVNQIGIDKAYQIAHERFDVNITFDSVDLNKEFNLISDK